MYNSPKNLPIEMGEIGINNHLTIKLAETSSDNFLKTDNNMCYDTLLKNDFFLLNFYLFIF